MYLIRNKDGSIKKAFTNEFVQQGSNNVNYYDFAIADLDSGEWSCDCYFELPNGEYATLAGVPVEFNVDDIAYKGYRVYLSSAILSYAGILKVVSRVYDKNGNILYTYPYEQIINVTALSEEYDAPISEAEYKSFMALLASYTTSYNAHLIRKYDTMENALKDIDKIVESEHILISDGVNDYAMYYKAKSTDAVLTLVPNPTNWSEIYSYTGLSLEDLSKLSLTTLKDYVDKYDIKEMNTNLLTGVFTTTLTLKDLSTLVSTVNFNLIYYTKNEVYSKEESDSKFLSQAILNAYLTIAQAKETYLSKEDAKEIYENKTDLAKDYYNKTEIDKKNASQDTNINNVLEKANAAYALAEGKGAPHIFDTYKDMKEALLNAEKVSEYHLGDTIYIKEKGTSDYWISAILDEKGEYGYYELQVNETDLSLYQEKEDNSLSTESKKIVGAINENKNNIATKQESSDNSLSTESKKIVGAINENKGYIDTLTSSKQDKEDSSLITDNKTIVEAINENANLINANKINIEDLGVALNAKQEKVDLDLITESKETTTAINNIYTQVLSNISKLNSLENSIPKKLSDLENDKEFIRKDVSDLNNYYLKSLIDEKLNLKLDKVSEKTKLSELIDDVGVIKNTDIMTSEKAGIAKAIPTAETSGLANVYVKNGVLYAKATEVPVLQYEVVDTLPSIGESGKIYLLKLSSEKEGNKYVEYLWINDSWEELGPSELDLSEYAKTSAVDAKLANYYLSSKIDELLNVKLDSSKFNASDIISTLGTNSVNRSASDSNGNIITETYATKIEVNSKLENSSSAIINTLGNNAVNYATKAYQDENGNNIASTYQKGAFIVNGTVSTSGVITFTDLDSSALVSAISDKRRIIFVPSDKTLQPITLNSSSDNGILFGSVSVNNTSSTTIYNCKITITMNSSTYEFNVSGTYTSQSSNYYELPIATSSILGGVKVDNQTIKIEDGVISVAKVSTNDDVRVGDLIMFETGYSTDNPEYDCFRVLKKEGSVVEVMGMAYVGSVAFGTKDAYANSNLDTYLNTRIYNKYSDTLKAAIVENNINQYSYSINALDTYKYSNVKYSSKTLVANVGLRKVYAIDFEDIEMYFGGTGGSASANKDGFIIDGFLTSLIKGSTTSITFWTRSSCQNYSGCIYGNRGFGYMTSDSTSSSKMVYPAFKVDLSKIEYRVVQD